MIFALLKQAGMEGCSQRYSEFFPNNSKTSSDNWIQIRNANKHYIDKVTVKVNGKEVKSMNLDKQSSATSQVIEIDLPDLKKTIRLK